MFGQKKIKEIAHFQSPDIADWTTEITTIRSIFIDELKQAGFNIAHTPSCLTFGGQYTEEYGKEASIIVTYGTFLSLSINIKCKNDEEYTKAQQIFQTASDTLISKYNAIKK